MSNKQRLDENPLIAALFGALVGMGLEKEKAKKAAAQAVNQAQSGKPAPAPAKDYSAVMRQGSRGEGVKQLQQKLGMRQADGIFGPATAKAVKTFQQSQGLKVDGIVGPETKARIMKLASNNDTGAGDQDMARRNAALDRVTGTRIDPGTTAGGPSRLKQRLAAQTGEGVTMSNKNQINEEITISGSADDLIRMMQLAGAPGAKAVDVDDINQAPETPCGSKPEPDMGDMVRMMSTTEDEGAMGDEYDDEPSAPDEVYMNDVSASIPHGDDLHKKKRSYPKAAGGDNPMALEAEIRAKLEAALEEKKKSPAGGPACWDGKKIHPTKPTKMKGGKRVNNCIDADSSDGK